MRNDETVKMKNTVEQILEITKNLAESEGHPDPVARLYAVQMQIDMIIGKEMLRIRNEQKDGK